MKKGSNGLYRTKVLLGHESSGKAIYKWISGHTVKEIERKKEEVKRAYIGGDNVNASDQLVTEAIAEWLNAVANTVRPQSMLGLRIVAEKHLYPKLKGKRIKAVRRADLQNILNDMEGYCNIYIANAQRIFRHVFGMAYSDGIIAIDPSLHLVKPKAKPQENRRALTAEERAAIEAYAPQDVRLALLYYTGMRLGELRALSWSDIDLPARLIHITKTCTVKADAMTPGKTAAAKRDIPIVPQLFDILQAHRALPHVRVFKCSSAYAEQYFKDLFYDLGLIGVTPHYLRHNFVTICWERSIDVMITSRIVGHATPTMTMNIYTHLDKQHGQRIQNSLDSLFDSKAL